MTRTIQAERLAAAIAALGATPGEVEELLAYNENPFDLGPLLDGAELPPPDEPFVPVWEAWAEEARVRGALAVLAEHLPQLRFPVRAGISETEAYRAATLKGTSPDLLPEAAGLEVPRPELIELQIHQSPAGRIPVLVARGRAEFVALVQALSGRNEPRPVPDSQGALMVSGYNDWARLRKLRERWEAQPEAERETATWGEELARLLPHKELYQDRFIILSDGPYSAVPAADLGLGEDAWREASLALRRDHECAHYFTRRLLGAMRNNLLDELIADYAGMVAAVGRFHAAWFLRFVGLEDYPRYRPGGRLDIYRGKPPLSDGAFAVLHHLVKAAAENLESFDRAWPDGERSPRDRALALLALTSLRLEEIASPEGEELLRRKADELRGRLRWRGAPPDTPQTAARSMK